MELLFCFLKTDLCKLDHKDVGGFSLIVKVPDENAAIIRAIFSGEKGCRRNAALLNAGAGLYLNGKAENMKAGVALAAELVDSGKAAAALEKIIEVSNRPEEEE